MSNDSEVTAISPFFIVRSLAESVEFYTNKLGFRTDCLLPKEDPFFAIVRRNSVRIHLKEIDENVLPNPNHEIHAWARIDAFISCVDPDAIYREYEARNLQFHKKLDDTDDGLRTFEIKDSDGYVLCFARVL